MKNTLVTKLKILKIHNSFFFFFPPFLTPKISGGGKSIPNNVFNAIIYFGVFTYQYFLVIEYV